ncbi:MAG TPA: hypothetical protein VMV46_08470 [Thermoanaerobaculia bacterium]|nr:hypothetical protein [Thermoanaerobaculia bacterium]
MRSWRYGIRWALVCVVASLATVAATPAQDLCAGANKVTRLGGRQTMFYGPLSSEQDLQALFAQRESEIRTLLRQVGFQGDPDDLFAAVRSGEGVSRTTVEPGRRMGWMFFRRRDQPIVKMDACWAGKEAFSGYQVTFVSGDTEYTLVAPDVCGNLALLGQRELPPVPPPTCRVQVSHRCESFTIDATGTQAETVTLQVDTPSGSQTLSQVGDSLRWTVDGVDRQGTYTFTVIGTSVDRRGEVLECRVDDSVTLDIAEPSIAVSASATDVFVKDEVLVSAAPQVDPCAEITAVALDGRAVPPPYQAPFSWAKPGAYTVEGVVTDDLAQTARDQVTINVTRSPGTWTLRPFLGRMDTDDTIRQAWEGGDIRRNWLLDGGVAAGVQAEYRFRPWFGLAFGGLIQRHELHFMFDTPDVWLMDDDDLDGYTLFAGPLFHLTPERRVDIFLGPLVAYTDWQGVDLDLGPTPAPFSSRVPASFDSELTFGLQAGVDIPFRPDGRWGLYVGLMYFELDAEADDDPSFPFPDAFTLGVDPISLNLGLSFDF